MVDFRCGACKSKIIESYNILKAVRKDGFFIELNILCNDLLQPATDSIENPLSLRVDFEKIVSRSLLTLKVRDTFFLYFITENTRTDAEN
jgi:hypothetical protein